jgi:hypothetical protein
VLLILALMPTSGWSQEPTSRQAGTEEPAPTVERQPIPESVAPSLGAYPLELLGLLGAQARRGGLTLTPSIAVSEEYNDNVDANNQFRQWDFITNFSPAVMLFITQPTYELTAGYSFTAAIYAREPSRNTAFDSQNLLASGLYRLTPGLTVTASDSFVASNYTNVVAAQGISTGRQKSWRNTFVPGVTWQMTQLNSLDIGGTYSVLRYHGQGGGIDSDTLGARGVVTHAFTPRLSGNVGYEFTYLDEKRGLDSTTHTPRAGIGYQFTRTLNANVSGGPAITLIGGDTVVTPAVTASLAQTLPFGLASIQYTRAVSVAGGAGGTNDTQIASGMLTVSSLLRGLIVALNPSYAFADPIGPAQPGQGQIKVFSLGLSAAYEIYQYVTLIGSYSFFHQRAARPSNEPDADQNRVRFGLQFGYPINFD